MDEAMSPQARRRLNKCLHGQEWRDLAWEIAEALENADVLGSQGLVMGEAERAVILAALKGEHTDRAGDKLHHVDGTHRSTPPTASGRAVELHQAALERHMVDGHTHDAPTHVVDTEGRTAAQFLAELFEYEYCDECGGDVADHDAIPIDLGEYGGPYFFARCKYEVAECPMDASGFPGYWYHVDSKLTPCNPGDVDPQAQKA